MHAPSSSRSQVASAKLALPSEPVKTDTMGDNLVVQYDQLKSELENLRTLERERRAAVLEIAADRDRRLPPDRSVEY